MILIHSEVLEMFDTNPNDQSMHDDKSDELFKGCHFAKTNKQLPQIPNSNNTEM